MGARGWGGAYGGEGLLAPKTCSPACELVGGRVRRAENETMRGGIHFWEKHSMNLGQVTLEMPTRYL